MKIGLDGSCFFVFFSISVCSILDGSLACECIIESHLCADPAVVKKFEMGVLWCENSGTYDRGRLWRNGYLTILDPERQDIFYGRACQRFCLNPHNL